MRALAGAWRGDRRTTVPGRLIGAKRRDAGGKSPRLLSVSDLHDCLAHERSRLGRRMVAGEGPPAGELEGDGQQRKSAGAEPLAHELGGGCKGRGHSKLHDLTGQSMVLS